MVKPVSLASRSGRRLSMQERERRKASFLRWLERFGNVRDACDLAGISYSAPYDWRRSDPEFASDFAEISDRLNAQWCNKRTRRGDFKVVAGLSYYGSRGLLKIARSRALKIRRRSRSRPQAPTPKRLDNTELDETEELSRQQVALPLLNLNSGHGSRRVGSPIFGVVAIGRACRSARPRNGAGHEVAVGVAGSTHGELQSWAS